MNVLIIGGAGYIGSHMVALLAEHGADVTTFDNLSSGYRDSVIAGEFVHGDLADPYAINAVLARKRFDAVMHFASYIQVGESVRNPAIYYRNNVANTLNLLQSMVAHDVKRFIFSSTAAVFGVPQTDLIDEEHVKAPINPYGASKLMVERMLADFDVAYGLKSVALRYFNAAGADPLARIGERHEPETHLIPLVLQAASGYRPNISVFGRDYQTADGTCIRDYIHVRDLADAHRLAIEHLLRTGSSDQFNLGNGNGYSVAEVIEVAKRVTGRAIEVVDGPRREGDPAKLVANSTKAKAVLGWNPQFADLETIVKHAWAWEQRQVEARKG